MFEFCQQAAVAHMSEDPQYTQNDIDKLIKKSQVYSIEITLLFRFVCFIFHLT